MGKKEIMHKYFIKKNMFTLTTTRLTKDTAFNDIFHQYIKPIRLTTMVKTVNATIAAECISRPRSKNVATNTAAIDKERLLKVSGHIVKYCS